jgi:hypothetical protein
MSEVPLYPKPETRNSVCSQLKNNYFAEMRRGSYQGSYVRPISLIARLESDKEKREDPAPGTRNLKPGKRNLEPET